MTESVLHVSDPVLHEFADLVGSDGPVAVRGGGTRWDLGGVLDAGVRVISAPSGIVDYRPAEMTVQVRAGTRVADLDAALAERGQRCALPLRGGTVGGAVAVGEDHTEVLGRGLVRDSVLQVRYASAEGSIVTGGGPVVKNVSGFNIPKLMTGSLGTLGLIAEVVLRTNPIPPVSRWVRSDNADPFAPLDVMLRPSAILTDGAMCWVLVEGHPSDVDGELGRLAAIGSFHEVEGPPSLPTHRWSMAPSELRFVDRAQTGQFVASVGVGRLWGDRPPPTPHADPVVDLISARLKENFDPSGRLNPGRTP